MQLHYIIENELLPKKVVAIMLVRFFGDAHRFIYKAHAGSTGDISSELLFASSPKLDTTISFHDNITKPQRGLEAAINDLAERYRLSRFKPRVSIEENNPWDYSVEVRLGVDPQLDDKALAAAEAEAERLRLGEGDEPVDKALTVTF